VSNKGGIVLRRFHSRFSRFQSASVAAAPLWLVILLCSSLTMAGIARAQTSAPAKAAPKTAKAKKAE